MKKSVLSLLALAALATGIPSTASADPGCHPRFVPPPCYGRPAPPPRWDPPARVIFYGVPDRPYYRYPVCPPAPRYEHHGPWGRPAYPVRPRGGVYLSFGY